MNIGAQRTVLVLNVGRRYGRTPALAASTFRPCISSRDVLGPAREHVAEPVNGREHQTCFSHATPSPLFVNMQSATDPNLSWVHVVGPFSDNQLTLTLFDLYYRLYILEFRNRPELSGRDRLVDVLDADLSARKQTGRKGECSATRRIMDRRRCTLRVSLAHIAVSALERKRPHRLSEVTLSIVQKQK